MQDQKKGSTRTAARPSARRTSPAQQESAFSAHFLEKVHRREDPAEVGSSPLSRGARCSGPWEVERVPHGKARLWAVTRREEPAQQGGGAKLACRRRQEACLGGAALRVAAVPNHVSVNTDKPSGRRSRLGYPVHDGTHHIGHLSRMEEGFVEAYHTVRCLAADPDAAALFIEALDAETLALLGRAIMRRLG